MTGISLRRVEKAYGSVKVIHGVDIEVDPGAFVVMVGPSGCGKSTLLRMIAGLEDITKGEIAIGGRVVNDVHPKDRDIAMVFQNYGLYPHMTVAENMGFALRLQQVPKAQIAERVHRAADILALGEFLKRKPGQLSGGQRQRVAMGRAIVRDPQVFLFDEPLSNLDAKLRVAMRGEIKALHQRLGTTIVYVTHDQIEAMTMADRIVVMNAGHVQQYGAPLDLYDTPANLFVAGFIGSPAMNLIEGTAAEGVLRTNDGQTLPLPGGIAPGRRVVLGVRPEHLSLAAQGTPGTFAATVAQIEPTGAELHVRADLGATQITAVFRERHRLALGEAVTLAAEPALLHAFDAKTGLRLAAAA